MKKILAYFGIIDGRQISPEEQENFGKNIFLIGILLPIIFAILFAMGIFDK
jgi:hypothetical protein